MLSSAFGALNDAAVYYSFDDDDLTGSNPNDLSGNGYNGVNNAAITGVTGVLLQQFDYDGINSIVTIPNRTYASTGTVGFSFERDTTANSQLYDSSVTDEGVNIQLFNNQVYARVNTASFLNGGTVVTGNELHVMFTWDGTTHRLYIDNVEVDSQASTAVPTTQAYVNRLGASSVGGSKLNGKIDEFFTYDRVLSSGERSDIYNSGALFNPYAATNQNVTIRVNDLWDNSALSDLNVTVTYANATTVLYQNATGNQIYTDITKNATLSVDLTYSSTNYFSKTDENVNLESDITGTLFQTETRFNASELFNNITVEGNFTIFNGNVNITKASNEIFNLNQNNYTVYFESDGYFNKSQDFEIFALTNSTETITDVFNSNLTISGINLFDNSTITNFSFTIFNENMSQSYTNVNESKNIYPFQSGVYNITATAPGFFDVNQSNISISAGIETYSIGFQQEGALAFFIRDIDTGDLISGSNTTVIFNNATTELQFSTISGIGSIEGLIVNNTYDVVIANSLYERSFTGFTYIQDVEQYDFYLTPNGTEINFNIVSVENKAISGALVQIETFVNGLPVLVQSAFTDVRGFTRFILPVDKTYFVTVTQSEYQGVEDILINFNNPDIKIVLQSLDGALDTTGTEGIRYSLTPKMTVLESNQTINWVYSVFSSDSQLESFSLGLYNGTTLLSFIDSTNTSGGTLNLSLNLTSPLYDEAKIRAVITYKKIDEDLQTLTRIYSITQNINYDGSLLELRDWMQENIGDMDRFIIFVLAFFTVMIVTAIFIKGFANVIISVLMAFIIGWLVGMNLFLIISIGSILLLGMIAWSNEIR